MSAIPKQRITSRAAAEELWRVAEAGSVDELGQVLSRGVNVNARNKHGMTALMRASYHGHVGMVRALLEHGADPNLARNDKFTALALAAFFGHTEVVLVLIEHGANTQVITRCGASAQTWAIARTFDEAARCLESPARVPVSGPVPAPAPVRLVPALASAPAADPPASVPAVRTLKDPPEIWDLVHEVPRGFNAGSAFMSRLTSMKMNLAFRVAAIVLVSAACVVGALVLRGSQAHSLPAEPSARQRVIASEANVPPAAANNDSATSVTPSAPETAEFSHHSEVPNDKPLRKPASTTRPTRARSTPAEEPVETVQSREVPAPPPVKVVSPPSEPRKPALSPQLISPATTATPKAKVIQWP